MINNDIKLDISTTMKSFITNKERMQCRILADIFREELEKNDIIIKETARFGFVMLQYYEPIANFDSAIIFTNCQKMFYTLLDEWFWCQITELMNQKQVIDKDIDDFYNELCKKEKENLIKKKDDFVDMIKKKINFIQT